jgi:hypothetical protein
MFLKLKKQKKYSMYVFYKIKKHIFTSKLFGCIKTFKTKQVLKIFQFFFLNSVQGAWCDGRRKFLADRRIFKHC